MKTLGIEQATLDACVRESQGERVLVTVMDARSPWWLAWRGWTKINCSSVPATSSGN